MSKQKTKSKKTTAKKPVAKKTTKKAVAKKPVAKKIAAKKVVKPTKKKTLVIAAKQIGQNIIIVVNKQQYSKRFTVKKHRKEVLDLIKAYNERNSIAKAKVIVGLMQVETNTKKTKKAKVVKRSTTKAKAKVSKTVTKKTAKHKSTPSPTKRVRNSGEY